MRIMRPLLSLAIFLLATTTTRAQFGDGLKGGGSAGGWSLKVDPPTVPFAVAKDLAIPIPQGFGQGAETIFPTSRSPFVLLGKGFFDQDSREVWDLRTRTKVGTFRGRVDLGGTACLSADGTMVAAKPNVRDAIEIRATKTGRVIQSIDPIPRATVYVDFGTPDQILAGNLFDKTLKVWSIKSGDPLFEIHLNGPADKQAIGFSPGRRYLASVSKDDATLRVFDLADGGKTVGEQAVAKGEGDAFNPDCKGVAFSDDGTAIAAVFERLGKVRIVSWDVADGKQTADHTAPATPAEKINVPPLYADRGIQWLTDKSGWLVFGSSIVDKETGKKVWSLPYDNQNFTLSPRRLVDNERALIVFGGNKVLRVAPVPYDKVQAAMKIARSGGNAADAALPPLKPADLSAVRTVTYASGPSAWSAVPDGVPSATRLASRPIPLKATAGDITSILLSSSTTPQALVSASPGASTRNNNDEVAQRWADRYDLIGGRHLGRIDIPAVAEVVAFSPEATRIAVRESKTRDRIDVIGVDNKPIAGWRPYENEAGDARAVSFAAFLDANRLLTMNRSGRLVLWSLPAAKAIYAVDDAFAGTPSLSPGRTILAGFSGDAIRFVDAATGALKGEAPGPNLSVGSRTELKASAFQSDGGEWAGIFGGGQVVRVDVKTGKVVGAFKAPVEATSLEYCGFGHLLADGRTLIDLATRRGIWAYKSGPFAPSSPDGRHWFTASKFNEPAVLAAIVLPEKGMETLSALLADAKAPAVVRPGSKVSLTLEFGGPPRGTEAFRKAVFDLMTEKLRAVGLTVAPGQPVTFSVQVTENNTGESLHLRKIGFGSAPGGPFNRDNLLDVPVIDLSCSLVVADSAGPVPCDTTKLGMRSFFHILRLPAGERDVAAYLRDQQWNGLKTWLSTTSLPYFVARSGTGTVKLPGSTDLNATYGAGR